MSAPRCPHCHAELRALPDGGVPELCPYCGDELPLDVGPSLATLLRSAPAVAEDSTQRQAQAASAMSEASTSIQEDDTAADNRPDVITPEAAKTADPVIDPETTRHATPDTDAPATSPSTAADTAAPPIAPEAEDAPEAADDATSEDSAASNVIDAVEQDAADEQVLAQDTPTSGEVTPSPSFLGSREHAPRPGVPRWQWAAAAGLILLLGFQLLYVQRDALARDAQWRPWMSRVCGFTGCTLAPWRELSAFHMLGRDVRAVAGRRGVLQVQATFRNDAAWPQPLPNLRVSLSDADGRVLGARVLRPADYLPGGDPKALIAPGQSVQATALLGEPDAPSVAFAFEFR